MQPPKTGQSERQDPSPKIILHHCTEKSLKTRNGVYPPIGPGAPSLDCNYDIIYLTYCERYIYAQTKTILVTVLLDV